MLIHHVKRGTRSEKTKKQSRYYSTDVVYNGEKYLREAIESILNQTYKDFEFLTINDWSTYSNKDIILAYNDFRIRLVDNEQNIGLTCSLNKGLKLEKVKYIARMGADDISM